MKTKTQEVDFVKQQKEVQDFIESQYLTVEDSTPQIVQWQQQGEEGEEGEGDNPDDLEAVDSDGEEGEGDGEEEVEEQSPYLVDQVNLMHGIDINVDYGDIDPDSVEGLYIRDLTVKQIAQQELINEIASSDPDAYAYLLHKQNGGSYENFKQVESLPDSTVIASDPEKQKAFGKRYLMGVKGLDEEEATAIIDNKIKNKTLADFADKGLKEWGLIKERELENLQKSIQQTEDDKKENYEALDNATFDLIENNRLTLRIPDTQKQKVAEDFYKNVVYLKGQLVYTVPVSGDNLADLIQSDYLFKNPNVVKQLFGDKKAKLEVATLRDKIKARQEETKIESNNSDDQDEYYRKIRKNPTLN